MRFLPIALLTLLSCACRPAIPLDTDRKINLRLPAVSVPQPTAHTPFHSLPARPPLFFVKMIGAITFEGVTFDARSHRLAVIDQSHGPGSEFGCARDVSDKHAALAAMNAGFFTPEGNPLGLIVSNGHRSGTWNSASSLGSGIFSEHTSGQLSIKRRSSPSAFSGARELVQAGPLLVENNGPVSGLDAEKSAVRCILLTDGGTLWWIGITSSCSLATLAETLASQSPTPWTIHHALNLDGGRSTDLFVSAKIVGGPFERRSVFNRPVRNFLILSAR